MPPFSRISALLFDLDGTLVDSRRDLAAALNLTLAEMRLPTVSLEAVGRFVGDGARMLVERGLRAGMGRAPDETEVARGLALFKAAYERHLLDTTVAYEGIREMLASLADFPKAVVTNKPYAFSVAILDGLELRRHFLAVVGGDSLPQRKPSPEPALAALERCGPIPAAEALMIGDSANDILAGRAAGMRTCGVSYGLRDRAELESAGADRIVSHPAELSDLVRKSSGLG
jgi:phosphoglycolate phosphatase